MLSTIVAHIEHPGSESNQFRLSANNPKFGEAPNVEQLHQIHHIIKLQLHNKINAVFDIIQIKYAMSE